jgi:hypothetical protein
MIHALRRPRLSHSLAVSLVAGLLAIVITLLAVSVAGPRIHSTSGAVPVSRPPATANVHTPPTWLANPFAPLSSRPLPSLWPSTGGSLPRSGQR